MLNDRNGTLIIKRLSNYITIALAFLVPLAFLPITTEFFSINKLALVTLATLLLLVGFGIRVLTGEKVEIIKSKIDAPLWILVGTIVLATIFSLSKVDSIYGSQGRWTGLFAFLVMVAYFYISSPNLKESKTVKTAVYAFIISATISSLVSIFSYFSIFVGDADLFRITHFTATGSVTDALLIASIAFSAAIGMIAYEKNQLIKISMILPIALNFFYIALVGYPMGWVLLAAGIISIALFIAPERFSDNKFEYFLATGLVAAILLVTLLPNTREILINSDFQKDTRLPVRESWVITTAIIRDYPVLATGPDTFGLNFTRYRPLSLNNTDMWDIRFDKPYNEYFNVLSTLGILGLVAVLFFAVKTANIIKQSKKVEDYDGILGIACTGIIIVGISYLFSFATVMNLFILFMFLGVLTARYSVLDGKDKVSESVSFGAAAISAVNTIGGGDTVIKKEYLSYIFSIPMFILAAYVGYLGYRNYAAEYYMRKAVVALANNDGATAYESQQKALGLNASRSAYQNAYAQTNLALANALASKQNLTDNDKQTIQTLIAQSIRSARITTEVLNPINAVNWEVRAITYRSIRNLAQNATDWSISSYNTAIQLDPTNPRLRLDLGGLYYAKEDYLSAANLFRQAASLKTDYANAYYNFAQALVKLNQVDEARRALETAKMYLTEGSDDYKKVESEIAGLPQTTAPTVAGASSTTAKPTVEQIEGKTTETSDQEPLTKVGEEQKVQEGNLNTTKVPSEQTQETTTGTTGQTSQPAQTN